MIDPNQNLIIMNNSKENSYIVFRRFKGKTIIGEIVNLPTLTILHNNDHIIFNGLKPISTDSSENCYMYFAKNDDDNGLKRGNLTQSIIKKLSRTSFECMDDYNKQWEIIWNDKLCLNYKRKDHEDFWLWNYDFYNASIEDLEYIKSLIKH